TLSMFEESFGWRAEPSERFKVAAMAWINGESVAVIQEIGERGSWLAERELPSHIAVVAGASEVPSGCACVIWVTDCVIRDLRGLEAERILWYRPRSLVVGVGCERGISAASLEEGLRRVLDEQGLAFSSIAALASLDLKADEAGVLELADQYGWQTQF